jgi:hypothetical protein
MEYNDPITNAEFYVNTAFAIVTVILAGYYAWQSWLRLQLRRFHQQTKGSK